MVKKKVLIIDDENTLGSSLARVLTHHGYDTTTVHSKKECVQLCVPFSFDLALLDLRLPDGNGLELIQELKKKYKNIQVIVMTGYGTIDLAVKATKQGAFHFITKPFDINEMINLVTRALSQSQLETENKQLLSVVKKQYQFDQLIGGSQVVLNLLEMIKKVSDSYSTVLITGESGVGKELIAKSIHFNSKRSKKPFVPVHCGAIPRELLESELFGHQKGSFTGAIRDHKGHFQSAEGGTLFLDEISTMEPSTQIKLLRVLQEKEFQPVGSEQILQSKVRVIAASNENLEVAMRERTFRKDLYYRLNVIPIHAPPLRQRTDDIPLLINYFIKEFNKNRENKIKGVSQSVINHLCRYNWPGNIRELENLIERLCVLKTGDFIELSDLPKKYCMHSYQTNQEDIEVPQTGLNFNSIVGQLESTLILQALEKTRWNRNQAAKLLGLNRTTLLEKIKKKGLKETLMPPIVDKTNIF